MPNRQTLEQMGESRLLRGILNAGGFLHVAQQLGLRVSRRPKGYWDNIENLDEVCCTTAGQVSSKSSREWQSSLLAGRKAK